MTAIVSAAQISQGASKTPPAHRGKPRKVSDILFVAAAEGGGELVREKAHTE